MWGNLDQGNRMSRRKSDERWSKTQNDFELKTRRPMGGSSATERSKWKGPGGTPPANAGTACEPSHTCLILDYQRWIPASSFGLQLPNNCLGNNHDGWSHRMPVIHVGNLCYVPGVCLWPGPVLATAGIWKVDQKMTASFVGLIISRSPVLRVSVFQVNKWSKSMYIVVVFN